MHAFDRLRGPTTRVLWAAACLALALAPHAASADDEVDPTPVAPLDGDPEPGPQSSPWPEGSVLGVIQGDRVNLRVGPRRDNYPVTQLDEGAVVVIVERAAEWCGVLVLGGFPVALSAKYAEAVGEDAIRIDATRLNLRVHPPVPGKPPPGAFRDYPERGDVLPVIAKESVGEDLGDWYWALAPESIRAYVSAEFIREVGAPDTQPDIVATGRAQRDERIGALVRSRRRLSKAAATEDLRVVVGATQKSLYRLRIEMGFDRTPLVKLADELETAMATHALAEPRVAKLAVSLLADLEAEIEMRLARHDAEVAALRGLLPEPLEPLTPKVALVEVRGFIRWEAAPKWRDGGVFILWQEDEPTHVLRLTTGVSPLPDLKGSADGRSRTIRARQPGARVFGLPALDVLEISE